MAGLLGEHEALREVTVLLRVAVCATLALTCAPTTVSNSPSPPSLTAPPASLTASPPAPTLSPTFTAAPSPIATSTRTSTASPSSTTPQRAAYCIVGDVPAAQRDYAHPEATVLDWTNALTESYAPPDLVSAVTGSALAVLPRSVIPEPGVTAADTQVVKGKPGYEAVLADDARSLARAIVFPDLERLRVAARAAGHPLVIVSAYRSFEQQVLTFDYWVGVGGYAQALRTSARPGHSEHQLGTTLDFGDGSAAPWEYDDWAQTPTGAWLAQHAKEYGFVMSYPPGGSPVTCYDYEPWHYRWVGADIATRVVMSGRTLREFQTGIR